jgi:hypothetical protein
VRDIWTTEVTIINNGVLPIHDVAFATFVKYAKANGSTIRDTLADEYEVPTHTLAPGEPVTTNIGAIFTVFQLGPKPNNYEDVDIALVARFRPAWAPFWKRTRIFRFKTVKISGGTFLRQVPAEDIERDYKTSLVGQ